MADTHADPLTHIARILRTDQDVLREIVKKMDEATGKRGVIEAVVEENHVKIEDCLAKLGVTRADSAQAVYQALIGKIREHDAKLQVLLHQPVQITPEGSASLINFAIELSQVPPGFFLKEERAVFYLRQNPPQRIVSALGYADVDELLAHENIWEIYSALRFVEDKEWLNNVFFAVYKDLQPDEFEERKITVKVLDPKWLKVAEQFVKKKYHNVSHLKELGVIFVLPLSLNVPGETTRLLTLVLHYLNEITFYCRIFRRYAEEPATFGSQFISALRGDVLDARLPDHEAINWMVVQRYLAKDDEYDWRLFEPHVNPEAIHWQKAEANLVELSHRFPELDVDFWDGLGYVGDYFKSEVGTDILASFNVIDTVMSLVQERAFTKFLYHHQEALWNRIFAGYVGQEQMEEVIVENFTKGYITL